jgi:hypothetical protein
MGFVSLFHEIVPEAGATNPVGMGWGGSRIGHNMKGTTTGFYGLNIVSWVGNGCVLKHIILLHGQW